MRAVLSPLAVLDGDLPHRRLDLNGLARVRDRELLGSFGSDSLRFRHTRHIQGVLAGLTLPGSTGMTKEVVAWIAVLASVLIEVGPGTIGLPSITTIPASFSPDRRPPSRFLTLR